jgi:phospholipid-transporting ATPase
MVKFMQGGVINKDKNMMSTLSNGEEVPTNVQSSNLNEELGQIHYVFSDKTGTLTCNLMEFKKISIGGISYGEDRSYADAASRPKVTNVDFLDTTLFNHLKDKSHPNNYKIERCLKFIAFCHTILCEEKAGELVYNASSPDELALVNWARFCGCEFQGVDDKDNMQIQYLGQTVASQLLYVLEFNSTRKRMSVVVRDANGSVRLMCKGADSILRPRMLDDPDIEPTWKNLEAYGQIGLRTLVLAEKVVPEAEFQAWEAKYKQALASIANREEGMMALQDEIEKGMTFVGATAIEDKLQDQVGDTIASLQAANIKVWVLTGDKKETAINIGFSCRLLKPEHERLEIEGTTPESVLKSLEDAYERQAGFLERRMETALIIPGEVLAVGMKDEEVGRFIVDIGERCKAVVACRVSPKQKQEIVKLVRTFRPEAITLSIGDGANDVNMITEAHVGVGIKGVEGQQAARASDYNFGEFKHLKRLVLYYGRENYRRNCALILYNFFKNMVLVVPIFWYGVATRFLGFLFYDSYLMMLFNIFYTSAPIILYSIYDIELQPEHLLTYPKFYEVGQKGKNSHW